MSAKKLFLIDAHALCYRSYYAIRGLTTTSGQATNAVYGFLSTIRKIIRTFEPEYMAICFDTGKKTHRQEKFAEYKIQRPAMPDDLISQIPIVQDVVEAYNLPVFAMDGFEADDVIATITHKVPKRNLEVVIVTDDKDMMQLLGDKVKIYSVRKDEVMDKQAAEDKLGFDPKYVSDLIGLAGDSTDNIPGVTGIGGVTAKNLIQKFGSLEKILTHIKDIPENKVKEKLIGQKETASLSKELALLDTNVPIKFDLSEMKVREPDNKRLFELFSELEFRKLAEELSDVQPKAEKLSIKNVAEAFDIAPLIKDVKAKKELAFAFCSSEEADLIIQENDCMVSAGTKTVFHVPHSQLNLLKELFEAKDIVKITHDIKMAMKVLNESNLHLKGFMFDVMLAGYLLSPSHGTSDLASLAWAYLKQSIPQGDRLAASARLMSQLYPKLLKELESKKLLKLFKEIEMPLAYVLYRMEEEGVNLDQKLLEQLSKEGDRTIQGLLSKVYKLAGSEFNLNSPKQLSKVLFEDLKMPVIKKTKTGFSTNEEVLQRLAVKHELPRIILEYRQLAKLKSTYIDALPQLIDKKDKRIHATFNQTGTETGRLSSNNPNLQNIPIRTELGRQIRKAFVPRDKDHVILAADYSQIELRILGHLSGDKTLISAFKKDQDIHSFTAALIFDVKEDKVTKDMRNSAKRVNFGIVYGMSAFGLAKDLKIPQAEAQDFIDRYFLRYGQVQKFIDKCIKQAQEKGYVTTLLNRRRYIPEINNQNPNVKQFAERQAMNTPVQGSAADLMKLAMILIQKGIEEKKLKSKMIITVHDELVFDVPKAEIDTLIPLVRTHMEEAMKLSVPIKVTMKMGNNWLDMKGV